MAILGVDHLELWVGNARQAASFFSSAFGFEVVARAGPETGVMDRASFVLCQGDVRLVVTGALDGASEIADHVRRHGDGVRAIALSVDDARSAFRRAVERGAAPARAPWIERDSSGSLIRAAIAVFGDTRHVLVERGAYGGLFAPGYEPHALASIGPSVGLDRIDHVVANVEGGARARWVDRYDRVFGWRELAHFGSEAIHGRYSALASTVVGDGEAVLLAFNEPAAGRRTSQIAEYLDAYGSPGVQHVALATRDIVSSVEALRQRGVRFLDAPRGYYEEAPRRMEGVPLPWSDLERLSILVDRDDRGHLLQTFTECLGDRPTLFFEIIQREGGTGFGEGNFRALFEAMERAQARRGHLRPATRRGTASPPRRRR